MLGNSRITWWALALICVLGIEVMGQTSAFPTSNEPCQFAGEYRIDPNESDRLYSVVRGIASQVPVNEQQQFFTDLSTRLTPPDLLALECDGKRVTVGSSRSRKLTFVADGISRRELRSNGTRVDARITMSPDTLIFNSSGKAEDSVNVAFQSLDNGNRLRVTRRIFADQLTTPIEIRTVYNKISDDVNWDVYGESLSAKQDTSSGTDTTGQNSRSNNSDDQQADILRRSLDDWIEATNDRDIDRQMTYYMPQLQAYYLTRNTPRNMVRREKDRVFATASSVDIRAEEPEIIFQDGGNSAIMRFRKQYRVSDRSRVKSGVVIQELRWLRSDGQWRITSERDIRVLK